MMLSLKITVPLNDVVSLKQPKSWCVSHPQRHHRRATGIAWRSIVKATGIVVCWCSMMLSLKSTITRKTFSLLVTHKRHHRRAIGIAWRSIVKGTGIVVCWCSMMLSLKITVPLLKINKQHLKKQKKEWILMTRIGPYDSYTIRIDLNGS